MKMGMTIDEFGQAEDEWLVDEAILTDDLVYVLASDEII